MNSPRLTFCEAQGGQTRAVQEWSLGYLGRPLAFLESELGANTGDHLQIADSTCYPRRRNKASKARFPHCTVKGMGVRERVAKVLFPFYFP